MIQFKTCYIKILKSNLCHLLKHEIEETPSVFYFLQTVFCLFKIELINFRSSKKKNRIATKFLLQRAHEIKRIEEKFCNLEQNIGDQFTKLSESIFSMGSFRGDLKLLVQLLKFLFYVSICALVFNSKYFKNFF